MRFTSCGMEILDSAAIINKNKKNCYISLCIMHTRFTTVAAFPATLCSLHPPLLAGTWQLWLQQLDSVQHEFPDHFSKPRILHSHSDFYNLLRHFREHLLHTQVMPCMR